jgi:hypothetical protein
MGVVLLVLLFLVGASASAFEGGWLGEASGCKIYRYYRRGTFVAYNLCPEGPSSFMGTYFAGQTLLTCGYAYTSTVTPTVGDIFVANYSLSDQNNKLHLLDLEGNFEYFLTRVPVQPPDGFYDYLDISDRGSTDGTISISNGLWEAYPENGNPAGGVYAYLGLLEPVSGSDTLVNITYASVFNPSGGRPQPGDVVPAEFTYTGGGWNLSSPLFNYTTTQNTTVSELDGFWMSYSSVGCLQIVSFVKGVYHSMTASCNRTQGAAVQMGASNIRDSVITVEPGVSTALPPGEIFGFAYTMDATSIPNTFTAFIGTVPLFYWKILEAPTGASVEITISGDVNSFNPVNFRVVVANATGLVLSCVCIQRYSGTSSTIKVQVGLIDDYKSKRNPLDAIKALQSTSDLGFNSVSGVVILDPPLDLCVTSPNQPPECNAACGLQPMLTLLGLTFLLLLR